MSQNLWLYSDILHLGTALGSFSAIPGRQKVTHESCRLHCPRLRSSQWCRYKSRWHKGYVPSLQNNPHPQCKKSPPSLQCNLRHARTTHQEGGGRMRNATQYFMSESNCFVSRSILPRQKILGCLATFLSRMTKIKALSGDMQQERIHGGSIPFPKF